MKRLLVIVLLCFCLPALAEEPLYPALDDLLDQRMQSISVMSQRDEVFEKAIYNGGQLTLRGCLPVSMANGIIASFGITDAKTAAGMVLETTELLVFPKSRGKGRAEMKYLDSILNPQERVQQAAAFPYMAETIGTYTGEIRQQEGTADAESVLDNLDGMQAPCMLVGRITVYPDWIELIRIAQGMQEKGMGDAWICLMHAGAGTENSGAPLRSGEGGHYIAMMIHVDTFVREGRMYLLDSLPRALKGEIWGYTEVLRRPYPFWSDHTVFDDVFDASRISPTVVRFSLADRDAWQAADVQQKSKILKPMILFGPLVMMITLGEG